jgi:hypothetical protein
MKALKLTVQERTFLLRYLEARQEDRRIKPTPADKAMYVDKVCQRLVDEGLLALAITREGRLALHCHNGLHCLAPESCICICGGCRRNKS